LSEISKRFYEGLWSSWAKVLLLLEIHTKQFSGLYNSIRDYTTVVEEHLSKMQNLYLKIFVLVSLFSPLGFVVQAQEEIDKNSETISVETTEADPADSEKVKAPEKTVEKTPTPPPQGNKYLLPAKTTKIKKSWSVAGSCNECVKVSTGATYLFFSQKPPANLRDVEYKNFTAPSILVEGFYRFYPGWRARFEYVSHSPAEIQSEWVIY
jgi:hypothetical protein